MWLVCQLSQATPLVTLFKEETRQNIEYLKGPNKVIPFLNYWTKVNDNDEDIDYELVANWLENSKRAQDPRNILITLKDYIGSINRLSHEPAGGLNLEDPEKFQTLKPLLYQLSWISKSAGPGICNIQNIRHVLKFYIALFSFEGFGLEGQSENGEKYVNVKRFLDDGLKKRADGCYGEFRDNYIYLRRDYPKFFDLMANDLDSLMIQTRAYEDLEGDNQELKLTETARQFDSLPEAQDLKLIGRRNAENLSGEVGNKLCKTLVMESSASLGSIILAMEYVPEKLIEAKEPLYVGLPRVLEYTRVCHNFLSQS